MQDSTHSLACTSISSHTVIFHKLPVTIFSLGRQQVFFLWVLEFNQCSLHSQTPGLLSITSVHVMAMGFFWVSEVLLRSSPVFIHSCKASPRALNLEKKRRTCLGEKESSLARPQRIHIFLFAKCGISLKISLFSNCQYMPFKLSSFLMGCHCLKMYKGL